MKKRFSEKSIVIIFILVVVLAVRGYIAHAKTMRIGDIMLGGTHDYTEALGRGYELDPPQVRLSALSASNPGKVVQALVMFYGPTDEAAAQEALGDAKIVQLYLARTDTGRGYIHRTNSPAETVAKSVAAFDDYAERYREMVRTGTLADTVNEYKQILMESTELLREDKIRIVAATVRASAESLAEIAQKEGVLAVDVYWIDDVWEFFKCTKRLPRYVENVWWDNFEWQ